MSKNNREEAIGLLEKELKASHRLEETLAFMGLKKAVEEALALLKKDSSVDELLKACESFIKGWPHFCKCINFGQSNLDAEAIRFMNEVPGQIEVAKNIAEG